MATLFFVVSLFLLHLSHAAPLAVTAGVSGKEDADVVSFMMNYGYLEPKDPRLGEVRSLEDLVTGIKKLQEFAGLEVTGRIDEETVKLIKKPRCSMADFGPSDMMRRRKRYALHHSQWAKHDLTYRVLNTSTSELKKYQVKASVKKAFAMWSAVSPLTFKEIPTGHADIMISFEARNHNDGYPFDGRGNRIAHAFYPHTNVGEDGDIHFDDEEHWTLNDPEDVGTDFMWTAVHEIGHALGVDHSTYSEAIMFPYYSGYKPNIKLSEDDIMAIQAKYGGKPVTTKPPTLDPDSKFKGPSPCQESFEAVVHSNDGNTYFFKQPNFWTLDKYKRPLGARKIVDHWPGLRSKVNAAYTRRDGLTVFFKGRKYWVYNGTKHIEGPKLITEYGLPLELRRLDAAFTWHGNGKTYFFKGKKYWRYNEKMKRIDEGYPKNISEGWGAVGARSPVDAVMTWSDHDTYFFNGLNFSKYDFNKWHKYQPEKIADFFFRCHERDVLDLEERDDTNGVFKTTMFAPLLAVLVVLTSFYNL